MKKFFPFLVCILTILSCSRRMDFEKKRLPRVKTYLNYLKDEYGRYVFLNGINVGNCGKFPQNEDPCFLYGGKCSFNTGKERPVYTGKLFPPGEIDKYMKQLKDLGFNLIRLVMMWEGIQPDSPDRFDEEYLDYIEYIVKKANEHNIYVLLDMHQDLFSRHLLVYFQNLRDLPEEVLKSFGSFFSIPPELISTFLALIPFPVGYNDAVRGDGAPRWAVKAIMPEKDMDSPYWGYPKLLGKLINPTPEFMDAVIRVVKKFTGIDFEFPEGLSDILKSLSPTGYPYDITQTTDFLPWTSWGLNGALSIDLQRSFAAFFAGRTVYPKLKPDGVRNIQDYLQDAYTRAWVEVARRVKDYPNVIGYDIFNEPLGFYLTLTIASAYLEIGTIDGVKNFINTIFYYPDYPEFASDVITLLTALNLLPEDNSDETKRKWGFEFANLVGLMGINYGFDRNYLQPFYERVGKAILNVDPDAIIWIEPPIGLDLSQLFGAGESAFQINMTRPEGIAHVVYAPHWYPDIYPFPGFNMPPRDFTPEEVRFRDYLPSIKNVIAKSTHSLGNIPVVLGEFGTYFDYGGIKNARSNGYMVAKEILDNNFEALEMLFLSRIIWGWSYEVTDERGDGWNGEHISVIENGKPRGETAYSRPYAGFISGKPVHMHFYSPHHYFDAEKGIVNPEREFELWFGSKESDAPTEIFIPYEVHYPEGFYVWITDGYVVYDHPNRKLYYYPTADEPGHIHRIRIRPPLRQKENTGWAYFFRENTMVTGNPSFNPEEWR